MRALTFFFFFGDHPNFRILFQIRTLGSIIEPSNALHRPAFVREIIEVSINLVKSVLLHRAKKRDCPAKSGTYGNPTQSIYCYKLIGNEDKQAQKYLLVLYVKI